MFCALGVMIRSTILTIMVRSRSAFFLVQCGTSFHLYHKWIFFSELVKQWWLGWNHHHSCIGVCGEYLYGEAKSYCLQCRQKCFAFNYSSCLYCVQHKIYLTASYVPKNVNVKEKMLKRRMPLERFKFIRWACWQDLTVQLYQSLHVFHVCLAFKELFKNRSAWDTLNSEKLSLY